MAEEKLVVKMHKVKDSFEKKKKDLDLFALLQREDDNSWDVILSIHGYKPENFSEYRKFLIGFNNHLYEELDNKDLEKISRVLLLNTSNNTTKQLKIYRDSLFDKDYDSYIENVTINDIPVKKLYFIDGD